MKVESKRSSATFTLSLDEEEVVGLVYAAYKSPNFENLPPRCQQAVNELYEHMLRDWSKLTGKALPTLDEWFAQHNAKGEKPLEPIDHRFECSR